MKQLWALFFFFGIVPSFSQTPAVVISSYYNAASPLDEWTELLVVQDNTSMVNWKLQNSNATQTAWEPSITFSNAVCWDHLRAGTIIVIDHRVAGGAAESTWPGGGFIEISPDDPIFQVFSGGSFGTNPFYNGPTLNIDSSGYLLVLLDASGNCVHALGHRAVSGPLYNALPFPKLNYKGSLPIGDVVCICPGANIDEYGNLAPQDGSTWTALGSGPNLTKGLPNTCSASATQNSDYWRSLRQPVWINPTLSGSANGADNLVTLNWSAMVDSYPDDQFEQYLILRNTTNVFGIPADGRSYLAGENIGGAVVVANIHSSQTLSYVDTVLVPCPTGLFYEIFAYRFGHDVIFGNNYNPARGSAYNETSFAATHVSGVLPVAPLSATSDHDTVCSSDNGNITLSAQGGSGATLNWYTTSCGGTLVGTTTGPANSLTIPSPATSTTYYAAWENNCGVSACAGVSVTVIPAVPVNLSITADHASICPGTLVTFTASAINEGNSPVYSWTVNGNSGQSGSSLVYRTDSLKDGDEVTCRLNSSITCTVANPVESAPLSISVFPSPVVNLTDKPFLCAGDSAHLDAGPGFASYLWQDGSAGRYYMAINTGTYRVTVADSHGCTGSDSVRLKNCDSTLFVPNAFSPNNDGVNDVFRVVSSGDNLPGFSMQIFDRWGALVFESTDINKGWNGQIQNRLAPSGTYVWIITYQQFSLSSANGSTKSKHGTVVLIR